MTEFEKYALIMTIFSISAMFSLAEKGLLLGTIIWTLLTIVWGSIFFLYDKNAENEADKYSDLYGGDNAKSR